MRRSFRCHAVDFHSKFSRNVDNWYQYWVCSRFTWVALVDASINGILIILQSSIITVYCVWFFCCERQRWGAVLLAVRQKKLACLVFKYKSCTQLIIKRGRQISTWFSESHSCWLGWCRVKYRIRMFPCSTIDISIQSKIALGTLENLGTTEFVMDKTTLPTSFGSVMLITNDRHTPFYSLVGGSLQQMILQSVGRHSIYRESITQRW